MYSPLLAAVLLVLCGQTLVLHSQPFFLGTAQSAGKKAGYARPARPLFRAGHYRFQYKLKAITPARLKSDLAMLGYSRFFIDSSFSETITLMISPLAATIAR